MGKQTLDTSDILLDKEQSIGKKIRTAQGYELPPTGYIAKFIIKDCGHGKALHHMYIRTNGRIEFSNHKIEQLKSESVQVCMAISGSNTEEIDKSCRPCAFAYYCFTTGRIDLLRKDKRFVMPAKLPFGWLPSGDEKYGIRLRKKYLKLKGLDEFENPILVKYKASSVSSGQNIVKAIFDIISKRIDGRLSINHNWRGSQISLDINLVKHLRDADMEVIVNRYVKLNGMYYGLKLSDYRKHIENKDLAKLHSLAQSCLIGKYSTWDSEPILTFRANNKKNGLRTFNVGNGLISSSNYFELNYPKTGWVDIRPLVIASEAAILASDCVTRIKVKDAIEKIKAEDFAEVLTTELNRNNGIVGTMPTLALISHNHSTNNRLDYRLYKSPFDPVSRDYRYEFLNTFYIASANSCKLKPYAESYESYPMSSKINGMSKSMTRLVANKFEKLRLELCSLTNSARKYKENF